VQSRPLVDADILCFFVCVLVCSVYICPSSSSPPLQHEPTIEDCYQKYVDIDDEKTKLELLDTAGDEQYSHIREKQLHEGHGFLLVFSLTDRSSFYSVRRYYLDVVTAHQKTGLDSEHPSSAPTRKHSIGEEDNRHVSAMLAASNETLHRYSDPPMNHQHAHMQRDLQVGVILVGTKADLEFAAPCDDAHEREVSQEEIEALAKELHLMYHEISCKNARQVESVFADLVQQCRKVNAHDCSCGAVAARAVGKKHAPCVCRQLCLQCNKKRAAHHTKGTGHHTFVAPDSEAPQACCVIQ
jgi:GTPase SAR1 family protein